ncbi:MAG: hypothetical protein K2N63_06410 [Lachnospiraceae bacterium]|nr:hypothetical protein [Lachnospiraceae bacterium]
MQKLPPIEKLYEAYSALADNRVSMGENSATVTSSDGAKTYKVEWQDDTYSSTDNATLWQGYAGYPVISILILQKKLSVDNNMVARFSKINWNSLNKKHKRDYRAALLEVFEQKQFTKEEINQIETETEQAFEQLKNLPLEIVRKVKRGN